MLNSISSQAALAVWFLFVSGVHYIWVQGSGVHCVESVEFGITLHTERRVQEGIMYRIQDSGV